MFQYYARIQPDPDGGFLVTFPSVPEAITHGEDHSGALANAREALGLALRGYAEEGRPMPEERTGDGVLVAVDVTDAMKLAVIEAFREAGISKSELARRLGKAETEARRILDPDHPTKLPMLEHALATLGKRIVIDMVDAA
ncbi:type II toxin-antitoxin system HicB family antitoxin [Aurantimonas sp. MSK8Z-1]|uniref:type II toxin-antitoxin system HicB family antitoxin n=1 Tax=Mangrovibrevibacter kandeliae TaxID=2968473 RepID=UPI0021172C23|nr:type II toxin-antitoxin system HicB family antitoxin [Aurantimonas sp. MSK8Z-1]MCW4114761.1 type II toxin-antitoxin system HicB family antitoxin [Aurantimonas sp. MSK8Z-1]